MSSLEGGRGVHGACRGRSGAGLGWAVGPTPTQHVGGKLLCQHRQRSWEDRARISKGQISPHHSSKSLPTAQQHQFLGPGTQP